MTGPADPPPGPEYRWMRAEDVLNDIGGTYEIAYVLGETHTRVRRWTQRRYKTHCPQPIRRLRMHNLYSIAEWVAWYEFRQVRLRKNAETEHRNPWI